MLDSVDHCALLEAVDCDLGVTSGIDMGVGAENAAPRVDGQAGVAYLDGSEEIVEVLDEGVAMFVSDLLGLLFLFLLGRFGNGLALMHYYNQ